MWTELLLNPKVLKYGAIALIIMGCVFYYFRAENKISVLSTENIRLNDVVKSQDDVIQKQKKDFEDIRVATTEISNLYDSLKKKEKEKEEVFNRDGKKNLDDLAKGKASLVEKRVNKATEETLKCLESATENKICGK